MRLVLPVVGVSLSGSVFSPRTWCLLLRPDPSEVSMEAQGVYQSLQHGRTVLKPKFDVSCDRRAAAQSLLSLAASLAVPSVEASVSSLCFTTGGQSLDGNL